MGWDKYLKNNDTHKHSISFPIGSTVVIQRDDGGPWMHGVIAKNKCRPQWVTIPSEGRG